MSTRESLQADARREEMSSIEEPEEDEHYTQEVGHVYPRKDVRDPLPCGGCGQELVSQESQLGTNCMFTAYELYGSVCTTCDLEIEKGPVFNRLDREITNDFFQICESCHILEVNARVQRLCQ